MNDSECKRRISIQTEKANRLTSELRAVTNRCQALSEWNVHLRDRNNYLEDLIIRLATTITLIIPDAPLMKELLQEADLVAIEDVPF